MAPKRFFTGSTSLMMRSASTVSAMMLPITKAPNALLKPTWADTTAIRQHSPMATTSIVSSLMSLRAWRKNMGRKAMPTTNHSTRKNTILNILPSTWLPSGLLPLAMVESITIITMARMSSRMSTLITMPVKCCWRSPMSSNAL